MCEIKNIFLTIFPNSELLRISKSKKTGHIKYIFSMYVGEYKMFIFLYFSISDQNKIFGFVSLKINFTSLKSRTFFNKYPRFKNIRIFDSGISFIAILIEYSAYFFKFLNCEINNDLLENEDFINAVNELTIV